jgi:hypothetical protein
MSTGAWGQVTWGYAKWGELGDATTSLNNTNLLATTTLGTGTQEGEINSGWGRADGWGTNGWSILGTLQASGIQATANLSSVTINTQINTGWGSDTWGTELWGSSGLNVPVNNTNLLITAAEGSGGISFDGDSNLTLTGLPLTATLGDEEAFASFIAQPTGIAMTMTLSYDPETVTPASLPITMSQGTTNLDANTIVEVTSTSVGYWGYKSAWGNFAWGNGRTETLAMSMLENFSGVDPEPDVSLTGNAMAAALAAGNTFDISGDANAPVTNVADNLSMTLATGNATLEALTQVDVTGFTLTATLNSVTEVTGTATVIPTGFGLTNSLGTDTNVLIWNGVSPGTAPIDPPGWTPVDTNAA